MALGDSILCGSLLPLVVKDSRKLSISLFLDFTWLLKESPYLADLYSWLGLYGDLKFAEDLKTL
jgi:hypothetical protein